MSERKPARAEYAAIDEPALPELTTDVARKPNCSAAETSRAARRRIEARAARGTPRTRADSRADTRRCNRCSRDAGRATRSRAAAEPLRDDVEHRVDAMPERVFGERATARVVTDRPRLVGMREVVAELFPELGEIAERDDLLPR